MTKDSIHIFVEGDTIALALLPKGKANYKHSTKLDEIGQRLGFVSISELHDPAKQDALRERIVGYYRNIPLDALKIQAVGDSGIIMTYFAITKSGHSAMEIASIEKMLATESADIDFVDVKKLLIKHIEKLGISTDPKEFRTSLSQHVASSDKDLQQTVDQIIRSASIDLSSDRGLHIPRGGGNILKQQFSNIIPDSEKEKIIKQRQREEFDRLLDYVPPAERDSAWERYNAESDNEKKVKVLKDIITKHLPVQDEEKLLAIYDTLATAVKEYGSPLVINLRETVDFETVKKLIQLQAAPEAAADELMADLISKKNSDYALPVTDETQTTRKPRDQFAESFKHAPQIVQDAANAAGVEIVIAKPDSRVGNIIPKSNPLDAGNLMEGLFFKYHGASAGSAIYLDSTSINNPAIVTEEVSHQIDHKLGMYTLGEEWKKAVNKDLADAKSNKLAGQLISRFKKEVIVGDGSRKVNSCFEKPHYEGETFIEALPDMMHLERIISEQIKKKGKFKASMFSSSYDSVDSVMEEAFPNMWKLYKGASSGNKLKQRHDGEVVEIPISQKMPDARDALSFAEACDTLIKTGRAPQKGSGITSGTIAYREDWTQNFGARHNERHASIV